MAEMEAKLQRLPTKKAYKRPTSRASTTRSMEEYTPIVKHMTRTQGRVLLKLIDRETDYTAYEVLREFRGGFVAGYLAEPCRASSGRTLKSEYDSEGGTTALPRTRSSVY